MSDATTTAIPAFALKRIREGSGATDAAAVFTSDFTVNEFVLVRKAGFRPIGLCMGSCVYHVGIQSYNWSKNQELTTLSQAMYTARELAMARMRAEATDMAADGIVGVRLSIKRLSWNSEMLEFMAFGTGVVHEQGREGFRAHDGGPFTSDLSGQDFWSLLHAGYRPVEMVMGSCVYHVSQSGFTVGVANMEMKQFSAAMYEAREIAMERMQSEASEAKAEGVVGVEVREGNHNWQSHVIEFFAVGTAVVPLHADLAPEKIADPIMVLSVND